MKTKQRMKILFATPVLMAASITANACDICGCGVGGNYIGILPEFNKHIIGLRYRHNSLLTHLGINGAHTYLTTQETYRTAELWGGWNITRNVRIMASVPYNMNDRENQGTIRTKSGPGDATLLGFYRVLNTRNTVFGNKLLVQSLWAGAGVKLPIGKYDPADRSGNTQNANLFQLGTGSTDIVTNLMYDIRLQDAGLNVWGSYKINTVNKYEYRYGNKFTVSAQPYYKFNIKRTTTIAPNAGVLYESGQKDENNKFTVDISGGYLLLGSVGVEVVFKKITGGVNFQAPLSQDLAMGIVKANNRAMAHVAFAF